MNQLGRDTLRAAALAGVPQITGRLADPQGGRCGLGVLATAIGIDVLRDSVMTEAYDLRHTDTQCPICPDVYHDEATLVSHLNDFHECDFLKLAEIMPVSPEEAP